MAVFTSVQLTVLRLIFSFDGQFGPYGIEAAMNDCSGLPAAHWTPILDQLDELEDAGMIRQQAGDIGAWRYRTTDRGREQLGRSWAVE